MRKSFENNGSRDNKDDGKMSNKDEGGIGNNVEGGANSILNLTRTKANIIDQIPAYNLDNIDDFIENIGEELKEQENVNQILLQDNPEKNIEKINQFIESNGEKIHQQLEKITTLSERLRNLVTFNHNLKATKNDYRVLVESDECKEIANKMREIKKQKRDLIFFLKEQGIHS
jgi:hypothetical protein